MLLWSKPRLNLFTSQKYSLSNYKNYFLTQQVLLWKVTELLFVSWSRLSMSSFIHCISYNATSFSKCSSPVNGVIHGQHEQYLVTFIAPAKTHTMKVMRQSCKPVLNKLPLPKWQQGIRSSTCRRCHIPFFSTVHLVSTAEIEEGSRECRSCCTTDSLPVG